MGDVFGRRRYDPAGPIFISYRQSDGTELAQRLDRFLRAGGLVPWRDLVDLPPGETARRVHEAFDEGISAAVLLVTPEIERSQFVPQEELPALLALEREPHDFSLTILNTIPKDGPQADDAPYPDATHPLSRCARSAEFDIEAPDRLLKTKDQPLRDLKQYGLEEFRRLYRDLLHRRLRALARSAGWLPTELPGELVAAIRTHAGGLPGDFGIGDGEVTIQTQTRPVPDAQTRRSGTTSIGREHDLAIRLRQDEATGIPAAEDYRRLQQTLPILVDGLFAYGVSRVKLTGGGHFSLGWALGAALPVTRQGGLHVVDPHGCVWTDANRDGDDKTFQAVEQNLVEGGQHDTGRLRRVAVLIRNCNEQNQPPFDELKTSCDDSFEIILKGEGHIYPANEGARLAKDVADYLRKHGAGKELHIAWSTASALAPLVARRTNTLNCVLYELTQESSASRQRYRRVLRVSAGNPGGPIVDVFDDDVSAEPPTRLINLTPHAVRLYRGGEVIREWPAPEDGRWVRVAEQLRPVEPVRDDETTVPVTTVTPGGLVDEPKREPGVGYIVSRISAQAARRSDFYFPLDEVRDADGNILGVKGLGQFPSGKES